MPAYFFDTSAIVKRYVAEIGQGWVARLTNPVAGNTVHLAQITGVEVVSAITRRQCGGSIRAAGAVGLPVEDRLAHP